MKAPKLDHPVLQRVKAAMQGVRLRATEYRGQTSLIVEPGVAHRVLAFLKTDAECDFNFLADLWGVDYLNYPAPTIGRFGVGYNLVSMRRHDRLYVKTFLDPSRPTEGIEEDPSLWLDSVCDIWPGAEWMEREVFDMFGVRFRNHPDLRRILTWEDYPAHPLRKDYPLRGQGEREHFKVIDRSDA
jgi:NADH-quinone oxidoreductase subunit C